MELEDHIREALLSELKRQAAEGRLTVKSEEAPFVRIEGRVNVDELSMALLGALSGGP